MDRAGRLMGATLLLLALATPTSSHAGSRSGTVLLPTASPSAARLAWVSVGGALNGALGYVIDLPGTLPVGKAYTLTRDAGVGPAELDVWFYEGIGGLIEEPQICPAVPEPNPDGEGGESGVLPCNADYAIVVLFFGADIDFTLHW